MVRYLRLAVLLLSFTLIGQAKKPKYELGDGQTFQKNFGAEANEFVDYEIGKSPLVISVKCLPDSMIGEANAKRLIEAKVSQMKARLTLTAKALSLGEPNETWGYDFDNEITFKKSSPVENYVEGKNNWRNLCTGEKSETPLSAEQVLTATKTLTVWFPNKRDNLSKLHALIKEFEELSAKDKNGPQIVCNAKTGNFDLDVTEATAKKVWAALEAESKELVAEKIKAFRETVDYETAWKLNLKTSGFFKNERNFRPKLQKVFKKANGTWCGTFKADQTYTVFCRQLSGDENALLKFTRDFKAEAEVETEKGLYAKLDITLTQGCFTGETGKTTAEKAVGKVGKEIFQELDKIKEKSDGFTFLDFKEASAKDVNPTKRFSAAGGKTYYYNPCDKTVYKTNIQPDVKAWKGIQKISITSEQLTLLDNFKKKLEEKFRKKNNRGDLLVVTLDWQATADVKVLEEMDSKWQSKTYMAFKKKYNAFRDECQNLKFGCLTDNEVSAYPRDGGIFARIKSLTDTVPSGYSKETSVVQASERGKKEFFGTYRVVYRIRKVLTGSK